MDRPGVYEDSRTEEVNCSIAITSSRKTSGRQIAVRRGFSDGCHVMTTLWMYMAGIRSDPSCFGEIAPGQTQGYHANLDFCRLAFFSKDNIMFRWITTICPRGCSTHINTILKAIQQYFQRHKHHHANYKSKSPTLYQHRGWCVVRATACQRRKDRRHGRLQPLPDVLSGGAIEDALRQ